MGSGMLSAATSRLLIVDAQERLMPAVDPDGRALRRMELLARLAASLFVPCVATEHMPARIGPLVPSLRAPLPAGAILHKTHFDATAEAGAPDILLPDARQIVLCGAEAHICVLQTALGLRARGAAVYVVADAIAARRSLDAEIALRRMAAAGIVPVTTDMVAFEWLGRADTDLFRDALAWIKDLP